MKKSFILAFLSFAAMILFSQNLYAEGKLATVQVNSLHVRSEPDLAAKIISKVTKGAILTVRSEQGEWLSVQLEDGQTGWVAKRYLEMRSAEKVMSTVDDLRVRQAPATSATIIGYINKAEPHIKLAEKGNWTKISFKQKDGWVASKYVTSETQHKVVVQVPKLNVRTMPDLVSPIIGQLLSDSIIPYVRYNQGWYEILHNGQTGWISGDYVKTSKTEKQIASASTSSEMIVTGTVLNVRSHPSLTSKMIGKLVQDATVQIAGVDGDWSKIRFKNQAGWVASKFLTKKRVTILNNGTNIRNGPSTTSEIVDKANQGATFPVIKAEGDWYKIALQDNKTGYVASWIVSTSRLAKQKETGKLAGKTIVIDPGHGGKDIGTISANGTYEKGLTLRTATRLAEKLRTAGANVILTRSRDDYIFLNRRVNLAYTNNANVFISLHYDSTEDATVNGISTFYYDQEKDEQLAEKIQTSLTEATGLVDRKTRIGNYLVLRENEVPSILIELGFLSNSAEAAMVGGNAYQEKAAEGIFTGLTKYFAKEF